MKAPAVLGWVSAASFSRIAELIQPKEGEGDPASDHKADTGKSTEEEPASDPSFEAIQKVRDDLGTFGTAVGVGSTLVVGASAFATLDSLFPLPGHGWWLAVVAVFLAAIGGSVGVTHRFFAAKRRILIDTMDFGGAEPTDISGATGGLSPDERKVAARRFAEFAAEEGVPDVIVAEARLERLARVASVAEALGQTEAGKYARAESKRMSTGLRAAIGQAGLLVIEQRSAAVYKGPATIVLTLIATLGVAGIFVVADWSKGEREIEQTWVTCQKDLKDKDVPNVREQVCNQLVRAPSPVVVTVTAPPPAPPPNPVEALYDCAATLQTQGPTPSPTQTISPELWERAVAACAGLPPVPTATDR